MKNFENDERLLKVLERIADALEKIADQGKPQADESVKKRPVPPANL